MFILSDTYEFDQLETKIDLCAKITPASVKSAFQKTFFEQVARVNVKIFTRSQELDEQRDETKR